MRDGALVCTLNSLAWKKNCKGCDVWRMVVWKDGAHERPAGYPHYHGIQFSTQAGMYYGGHNPCTNGDNFELCGEWPHNFGKISQFLF